MSQSPASRLRTGLAPLVLAAFAAACADGTGPVRERGVQLLSPLPASDTIGAPLPIEIIVRDRNGDPAPQEIVEIIPLPTPGRCQTPCVEPSIWVLGFPTGSLQGQLLPTNQAGILRLSGMRTGRIPGSAGFVVKVDRYQYADTFRIQVLVGAPAILRLAPADTAVLVGGSYTLQGELTDRFGNLLSGSPTFTSTASEVQVAGAVVTGAAVGRAEITASAAGVQGTARVTVVPRGTLAVTRRVGTAPSSSWANSLIALDGSSPVPFDASVGFVSDWSADGSHLLLQYHRTGERSRIYRYDVASRQGQALVDLRDDARFASVSGPIFSSDDRWVWFQASPASAPTRAQVWRVPAAGGAAELAVPVTADSDARYPSPSPDGRWVAYAGRLTATEQPYALSIFEMETESHRQLWSNGPVTSLAWSPAGDWIAFRGGLQGYLIRPDGTGLRAMGDWSGHPVAWSPDGRFILLSGWSLVDVASGRINPLPSSIYGDLIHASWRPN